MSRPYTIHTMSDNGTNQLAESIYRDITKNSDIHYPELSLVSGIVARYYSDVSDFSVNTDQIDLCVELVNYIGEAIEDNPNIYFLDILDIFRKNKIPKEPDVGEISYIDDNIYNTSCISDEFSIFISNIRALSDEVSAQDAFNSSILINGKIESDMHSASHIKNKNQVGEKINNIINKNNSLSKGDKKQVRDIVMGWCIDRIKYENMEDHKL